MCFPAVELRKIHLPDLQVQFMRFFEDIKHDFLQIENGFLIFLLSSNFSVIGRKTILSSNLK
jgi:hypothetical protein